MKYFFSLTLYRLVTLAISPLLIIALIIRSLKQKAYRQRLAERFGFYRNKMQSNGIVIHAASVGEVLALKAFILKTIQQFPGTPITVTTFTPTGSAQVKNLFGDSVQHCYLPFDNYISHSLFLWALKPKAMVFMETELWPSLIAQCHRLNVKLLLINGRLSPSSMKSYRKISWLITPTLTHFDRILTQSQPNQDNFVSLGANTSTDKLKPNEPRCQLSGNVKYDLTLDEQTQQKIENLSVYLPSNETENSRNIWVMASTHEGDENIALTAFDVLQQQFPQLLLVIIPRHPERFDEVASLCTAQGYTLARRSQNQPIEASTNIWLIDTLGELLATTALANIVTMGGSFSHIGGHNPLEPALFKKPVIVGKDMHNFTEIVQQLHAENGLVQLENHEKSTEEGNVSKQLADAVTQFLLAPEKQKIIGDNGYNVVLKNQGASDKSVNALVQLLAQHQ